MEGAPDSDHQREADGSIPSPQAKPQGEQIGPRRRGRRKKQWTIRVEVIDPRKYPQFQKNSDNPFAKMTPEQRIKEFDEFCGRIWARACRERVKAEQEKLKKAGDKPPESAEGVEERGKNEK